MLYLLPPLVRVITLREKCRLVRETLLLAEDDVTLLVDRRMLHIPHQSRLKGALAHQLCVATDGSVCRQT